MLELTSPTLSDRPFQSVSLLELEAEEDGSPPLMEGGGAVEVGGTTIPKAWPGFSSRMVVWRPSGIANVPSAEGAPWSWKPRLSLLPASCCRKRGKERESILTYNGRGGEWTLRLSAHLLRDEAPSPHKSVSEKGPQGAPLLVFRQRLGSYRALTNGQAPNQAIAIVCVARVVMSRRRREDRG